MHNTLITALKSGQFFPHPTRDIQLIETHISWILLTGDYAYKIKKPVNFGFLDFTTLAKRKQYCEAELSLNKRSAPEIYCGLVAISGSHEQPKLEDDGPIIEYAIRMRQFGDGQLFSELAGSKELTFEHVDTLAEKVAIFHQQVNSSGPEMPYGEPEQVYAPMQQNFEQIETLLPDDTYRQQVRQLEAWTESSYQRLKPLLAERKAQGMVRDCHGDMHLGNITCFQNEVTLFDCIEFNEDFRWIDVISDIAFLVMDFEVSGLRHFANRFLNHYLESTGDYAGLKLLSFYKVYRAIVRAKIALFTLEDPQASDSLRNQMMASFQRYIDLAESYTSLPNRFVLTMHGISGTGKSTVALRLVDQLGAIRIRSDVERKRLFELDALEHPKGALAKELYSEESHHRTYEQLAKLCSEVLDSGLSVIVDATNLKLWQREAIQEVADSRGVPLCIAYCQASMSLIREWLQKRKQEDDDASDANLDIANQQILSRDSLTSDEMAHTFVIHSNIMEETQTLATEIKRRYL